MSFTPFLDQGHVPEVIERQLNSAQDFLRGAALVVSGGKYSECGADPATIDAIAVTGAGASDDLEYRRPTVREFPPGYMQGISVKNGLPFRAKYIGGTPTVGTAYGIVKDTDGYWKVDVSDTSNTAVVVRKLLNATNELLDLGECVCYFEASAAGTN